MIIKIFFWMIEKLTHLGEYQLVLASSVHHTERKHFLEELRMMLMKEELSMNERNWK